jgi:hypothetical protein
MIGIVSDPYEGIDTPVTAPTDGIIIGRINVSVVNRAEALFHVAEFRRLGTAETSIESISSELENHEMDEEEIA